MFVVIDDKTKTFEKKSDLLYYLKKRYDNVENKFGVVNFFNIKKNVVELVFNVNSNDFVYVKKLTKNDDFEKNHNLYIDIGNTLKCISKII